MAESSDGTGVYEAMIAFDDARTNVATVTRAMERAYTQVCDAIGGRGDVDLAVAKSRFELEVGILADANTQLAGRAAILNAAVANGLEWQRCFVIPLDRCADCGAPWTPADPWLAQTRCNSCAGLQELATA